MRYWYNRIGILVLVLGVFGGGALAQEPNDHIFPAAAAARAFIDFDSKGFLVYGQRVFLVSAGMEYARLPRELWADRLLRLQRAGFNCVEVYTFWNFHEPREGVFEFGGDHDLGSFLKLVKKMGMYAIVRVGPYYCAEWDMGGYPLWLKFKPGLRVREPNFLFEQYVGRFFDRLLPIVAANQIDRGGAVILVQLENEHPAGWGVDMPNDYFRWLRRTALAHGIVVPYFFSGLHHSNDPAGNALNLDDPRRPNPWLSTEFWSVWYNGYGSGEKEARLYERRTWKIIARGGNGYNYYMAHGGSNFGYTNNDEDAASYDYGAAVGQGGDLRPIYYSFKRAALFARSFEALLENSAGVGNARKGPAGEIDFLDNSSDTSQVVVVGGDTLRLEAGEIFPWVKDFLVGDGVRLVGNTLRLLGIVRQGGLSTLMVYGVAGSKGRLHFSVGNLNVEVPGNLTAGVYMAGKVRVLVMNRELADRSWVIDDEGQRYIVCGPSYAGELHAKAGELETEGDGGAVVYTSSGVLRLAGGAQAGALVPRGVVSGWKRVGTVGAAAVAFDDRGWKLAVQPLQMGADGDSGADAWYRCFLHVDSAGEYTLLVEGADRARVFLDGVSLGEVAIKDGMIPLRLTKGRHLLAVFTAHDGRDKLAAYLGPLEAVARKGLYGRALLVKGGPAVRHLTEWSVLKAGRLADGGGAVPGMNEAGWKSYKIGDDAFDKREGFGWFRTVLPLLPAGARQAELLFSSVDENATVFLNGHKVMRHEGWNAPFHVVVDRIDTMRQPVVLTVFVENYSNEGGIDQPVRFSPWVAPVEVMGWRMRGGVGLPSEGASLAEASQTEASQAGDDTVGPCWWRASFTVPADSGWRSVWRVVPRALGHGSIWVNGHNLGRYPEKIPVNGLYIPGCWLKAGENSLLIYEEDGRDARGVTVEAEEGASRRVRLLRPVGGWGYVDPFIGTTKSGVMTRWGNEGGCYPGAVAVSGFMQLTPETRWGASRGYDYGDSLICVFSCKGHHSGYPGGSAGRLFLMPVVGSSLLGRPFRHRDEVAEPGYYRVRLTDDGTVVEAAAGVRMGEFRIRFGGTSAIFIGDTAGSVVAFSEPYTGRREVEGGVVYTFDAKVVVVRVGQTVGELVDFDALRAETRRQWEKALNVIEVEDDSDAAKTVFYTALYHSLLLPWIGSDSGSYGGFSPWDTFRSLHPLLSLLYPEKHAAILRSIMDEYRRSGYLPVESMTGDHSVPILVDAYLKGVGGIDKNEAYAAMLKSLVGGPFLQADRKVFLDSGFIPLSYPESVTRTVEYGYDDWVLGQYAKNVMGDEKMYRQLMRGAEAYRRLLYVPSMLLLPREGDSFRVRSGNSGYKEGDAWVYSYFAPQDVAGLIDRMGGAAVFSARLDSALRDGRIVFDNETAEHIPYLFSAAGRSDLTQYWVRAIMDERYKDEPGGLPGNDDLGAMSSWYVFSALGIYPTCPGRPFYTIGAPLFRRAVVHLSGGKELVITSEGRGCYVQRILIDGKPWRSMEISHEMLMRGGRLDFRMGEVPGPALETERREGPRFVLTGVGVSARVVKVGETAWVRYVLRNDGKEGVKRLVVLADGKAVTSQNRLVGAGGVVRDSISFCLYRPGRVVLGLGDAVVPLVVKAPRGAMPAAPETEGLEVRAVIKEGDSAVVRYTLKNIGWEAREFRVPLLVDEVVVGVDSLLLEPGEVRERSRVWKAESAGRHVWRIGGLSQRVRIYRLPEEAVVLDGGELVGGLLPDSSGWGNNVQLSGPVEAGGRGVRVGKDVYGWIAGSRSLDELGKRLTMAIWVYPMKREEGLVDVFTNGDEHVLQIVGGRSLTFFAGGWGRGDCTVDLPADWLNHWHFLTGVCDSGGLRLYIDGRLAGSTPLAGGEFLRGGGSTWMIGRNEEFPGQRIFEGRVDRPMIVQEALDAGAVRALYLAESR
jgi:beta-galactosidase